MCFFWKKVQLLRSSVFDLSEFGVLLMRTCPLPVGLTGLFFGAPAHQLEPQWRLEPKWLRETKKRRKGGGEGKGERGRGERKGREEGVGERRGRERGRRKGGEGRGKKGEEGRRRREKRREGEKDLDDSLKLFRLSQGKQSQTQSRGAVHKAKESGTPLLNPVRNQGDSGVVSVPVSMLQSATLPRHLAYDS